MHKLIATILLSSVGLFLILDILFKNEVSKPLMTKQVAWKILLIRFLVGVVGAIGVTGIIWFIHMGIE